MIELLINNHQSMIPLNNRPNIIFLEVIINPLSYFIPSVNYSMYIIMGIRNLMILLKRFAPESISYTSIDNYSNKVIGIDANLLIYKMIYAIRLNGYDIKNNERVVTHIHVLLSKLFGFIKYNITPVFVFDGMPPLIKNSTLEKRKEFQKMMSDKYNRAFNDLEKKKYYFMKSNISEEEINECIELINIFGYTVVDSIEEADSQLVAMGDKLDYIASDDMDILIFGGKNLLKNFSVDKKKTIQEISLKNFKDLTNLNQKQLVDLAILLGCDYCSTTKGIGTIGAYKLIQKHKSIEGISSKTDYKFDSTYIKVRKYFNNPLVMNSNKIKINKVNINYKKLEQYLKDMNYESKYIDKVFDKLDSFDSRAH